MRNKFIQQPALGTCAIGQVVIPINSRDELPAVLLALQAVFNHPEYNKRIFSILEKSIQVSGSPKGRTGMDLWEIIVLAVVRMAWGTNYDRLHHIANYDSLLRSIMGVGQTNFGEGKKYGLTTLKENIGLLDETTINAIGAVVLEAGQGYMKKKYRENINIKVDTYVLKTKVHFPTDLNLLYDAIRKGLEISEPLFSSIGMPGWRKSDDWKKRMKGYCRNCGRMSQRGGKNRTQRLGKATGQYLKAARLLENKISKLNQQLRQATLSQIQMAQVIQLDYFYLMLVKHLYLVDRRLIKGETIPSSEKLYSLFEPHTEWLVKGKAGVICELGHNLMIATDQMGFIQGHRVSQSMADVHLTVLVAEALKEKLGDRLVSISYDKGFYSRQNKENLKKIIPHVVLPKRGKRNQEEYDQEHEPTFKKLKKAHSAVESNINQLEYCGLDCCPDKGLKNYIKYAALGVLAYNFHKLGTLIAAKRKKQKEKLAIRAIAA